MVARPTARRWSCSHANPTRGPASRRARLGCLDHDLQLAVALYEALYGEWPFASPPGSGDPPVVTTPPLRGVPLALRQVLLRALRRDPDERYPSITELLAALAPRPRRAR